MALTESQAQLLEAIAQRVHRYRLETPAVLFLEMHKPLAFIGSQAFLVASPILAAFIGMSQVEAFAELIREPEHVERLIQRIEELALEEE
jgi:benzoyl-CoA reductase/2-hydroxyglutaryl-CoA dehydratase subunit BcrC/BadD/HgdB